MARDAPRGTKLQIIEAALATLRTEGHAGASARAIAREGGFNQALIFYHFGTVKNLLLAALDLVSERRASAYATAFREATTASDLARVVRTIYDQDLEHGYVKVLAEMVAAGMTDPELGGAVAARIEPWTAMVRDKLEELLADSPLAALASADDLAFALVALYFGVDMLGHLEGDRARAESLLDLAGRLSALADTQRAG